jgi:hypothetical protein
MSPTPVWQVSGLPLALEPQHNCLVGSRSVGTGVPAGRHWHTPAVQKPAAQSASVAHGWPSATSMHFPETHVPLQQSAVDRQAPVGG